MAKYLKRDCLAILSSYDHEGEGRRVYPVRRFLKNCGGRLVDTPDIVQRVHEQEAVRGEVWAWVDKWANEEGLEWANDWQTLVFELPLAKVDLNFAQQIWMFQVHIFGHMSWGGNGFVRLWWDSQQSASNRIHAVMGD
jgi:hypothetical protein